MDARVEFRFLQELRRVTASALSWAALLEESASSWVDADRDAEAGQQLTLAGSRSDGMDAFNDAVLEMHHFGYQALGAIESFLAFWGRASLILYPNGESSVPTRRARAERLRQALQIDTTPFKQRKLRNKWMHFDEVLDDLPQRYSEPHRFVSSTQLPEENSEADTCIRYLVFDQMKVRYAGVGAFNLRAMFAHLRELEHAVAQAIDNWAERNRSEVDAAVILVLANEKAHRGLLPVAAFADSARLSGVHR